MLPLYTHEPGSWSDERPHLVDEPNCPGISWFERYIGWVSEPSERLLSSPRRWAMGLGVMGLGLVLQLAPLFLTDRRDSLPPKLLLWTLEMPLLVLSLTRLYDWAHRRRISSGQTVLLSALLALAIGALTSWLGWNLAEHFFGTAGLPGPPGRPVPVRIRVLFGAITGLFHGGLWAFAFVYPFVIEDARLRTIERDKLRLEAETLRAQSELGRLRSQLEPHFLLNTLNAIAGLVTQDPREARRLLALLGELLGDTLADEGETQTLGREMAWLRGYTEILEARFHGSLKVVWDVDPGALEVLIPHLLLQPLVENAVTHGALKRGQGGEVKVRVQRNAGSTGPRLVCVIEDNGPGFSDRTPRSGAIGLQAVRRRLGLWSPEAKLILERTESGSRATVELPEKEVA